MTDQPLDSTHTAGTSPELLRPAVFLDRDGVLNQVVLRDGKSYPPPDLASFHLLPQVPEILAQLKAAGFVLLVVTNQPDVRTGKQDKAVVEQMHAQLLATLPLDQIFVCYHVREDHCGCKKPKPGMIWEAASLWQVDLQSSYLIGDRWSDIAAGARAGVKTFLLGESYQEPPLEAQATWRTETLAEVLPILLKDHQQRRAHQPL